MKRVLAAVILACGAGTATAQSLAAADSYRICPPAQTDEGRRVVAKACGMLQPPALGAASFANLDDLHAAEATRDAFNAKVEDYGRCVSRFIDSYRRPGADATSRAPDQAACAHSWAQDQLVQAVRAYGRACVDFSNRSMTDSTLSPWSGACYPAPPTETG